MYYQVFINCYKFVHIFLINKKKNLTWKIFRCSILYTKLKFSHRFEKIAVHLLNAKYCSQAFKIKTIHSVKCLYFTSTLKNLQITLFFHDFPNKKQRIDKNI